MQESDLLEKLRKIERLYAGASTPGEKEAAAEAMARIRQRLHAQTRAEKLIEYRFTLMDGWSKKLFLALLRRYAHARSPAALERSLHEHTEILAMIAARRSQDAARLLAAHSVQGRLLLQEALAGTDTIHHTGPEHDDTQHPG